MAGITGIGSGIDIDTIVTSMVAAEKAPKQTQLDTLEKKTTTKITSLGALKGAISTFQTALSALKDSSVYQARAATSGDSTRLSVSAGTTAGAGSYQVEVKQLAASSKVALASIPNGAGDPSTFGTGTLTLKVGDTALPGITIDSSNNTLAGIRDAINAAGSEQGLSATIVTDDTGARLVLSSTRTGAGEDIAVEVTNTVDSADSVSLSTLAFTPPAVPSGEGEVDPPVPGDPSAARLLSRAKSAELTVDGLTVTRSSNSVDDVIEGVTLNLKAVTDENSPITVGVSLDKGSVKANVQKFVDAYNALMEVVNVQTNVTSVGEDSAPVAGALVGDATARSLVSVLRRELSTAQGEGALRTMADLGITTQKDGTLGVDSAKLDKALADNFSQVSSLFAGDEGLASRLDAKLKPYTETGGILESRNKALSETISKIDDQREDLERRVTALQERLYAQFNAMDTLVAQLSNTSSSLAASLDALPWSTANRDN